MVTIFGGMNNLGSRSAFEQRKVYKEKISDPDIDFIDTWYENPRYGLLNSQFEPTVFLPGDVEANLKAFGDYAPAGAKAAPFVVKAFNDFREVYVELANTSALPYPKFLDNLIPAKGYINFESEYVKHGLREIDKFGEQLEKQKDKVTNFSEFMDVLSVYLEENASTSKITKTGFLLSNSCPINVSGLCLELSNLSYEEDFTKGRIIQSQEFRCFADAAKEVGFYIDKNVPWRLIANLESERMQKYIKEYEQSTTVENILDRAFRTKTHYDDLDALISLCKSTYESFATTNPFYTKPDGRSKGLRPARADIDSIEYWISFLLKVRMLEMGTDMSEYDELNRKVLDTHETYSVRYTNRPLKPALAAIGNYTSKHLKALMSTKNIDSSKPTTLKDFL